MAPLLTLILPALVPALTDGFRGLMAKVTGSAGAAPQNVSEAIALMTAQTDRVKALASVDALAANAAPWVANLRGSFRYVAVGAIELAAIVAIFTPGMDGDALATILDLAGASMSFIIGERMYLGLKSKGIN
jgi:hypothetical protein